MDTFIKALFSEAFRNEIQYQNNWERLSFHLQELSLFNQYIARIANAVPCHSFHFIERSLWMFTLVFSIVRNVISDLVSIFLAQHAKKMCYYVYFANSSGWKLHKIIIRYTIIFFLIRKYPALKICTLCGQKLVKSSFFQSLWNSVWGTCAKKPFDGSKVQLLLRAG